MSGLCNQQRQIGARYEPDDRIPGPNDRYNQHGVTTSATQNKNDSGGVSKIAEGRNYLCTCISSLLGKMNATACVIPPAPLFYRHLQMALANMLERNFQSYDSRVILPTTCLEELNWWDTQMCKWNGKSILKTETDLTIDSDASLKGWGARCHLQTTGGMVSRESKDAHRLLGAASCHSGSQIICQRQNQNFYPPKNRQYYSGGIHKSSGR